MDSTCKTVASILTAVRGENVELFVGPLAGLGWAHRGVEGCCQHAVLGAVGQTPLTWGFGAGERKAKSPELCSNGSAGVCCCFSSPPFPGPKFPKRKEHGQSVQIEPLMSLQEFGGVNGEGKENALRLWWESDREMCA